MSFLRLGVTCAVMDDDDRVLLSRRSDLNVWNLPGGRLDSGERLEAAAAREVREETGVIAHVERPVGLYYWQGWNRLNVLYSGWPLGGALQARTDETRENAYFDLAHLPEDVFWEWVLFDAVSENRPEPRIMEMPPDELRRVRNKLRRRWVKNLLMGRPEPRFPRFEVRAVGVVWDEEHQRALALPDASGHRLPRVKCDGQRAPWQELTAAIHQSAGIQPAFRWVGLWQDTESNQMEFIFAAMVAESETSDTVEWVMARNTALDGLDAAYVERIKPGYAHAPVWTLSACAENDQTVRIYPHKREP